VASGGSAAAVNGHVMSHSGVHGDGNNLSGQSMDQAHQPGGVWSKSPSVCPARLSNPGEAFLFFCRPIDHAIRAGGRGRAAAAARRTAGRTAPDRSRGVVAARRDRDG
jgi:hypothetical protein